MWPTLTNGNIPAKATGTHSVPSIIINHRHLAQGGQPLEVSAGTASDCGSQRINAVSRRKMCWAQPIYSLADAIGRMRGSTNYHSELPSDLINAFVKSGNRQIGLRCFDWKYVLAFPWIKIATCPVRALLDT